MTRRKRDAKTGDDMKPTKQEKQIATFVRFNCASKTTVVQGDEVHYFTGSKAVDLLMKSKWSAEKMKKDPVFTNRSSATEFMQTLLDKGMIWRARKLVAKQKAKEDDVKEPKKRKKDDKDQSTSINEAKKEKSEAEDEDDSKKKKNRKVKLEFHADQMFRDDKDVYVWHFDPISWTKYFIGLALLLGSIMVCLFPLWPGWLRLGVYYLSLCAMGFIGVLFALVILRTIIFGVIWLCTVGRHHFWLLPNLTEDCGFVESFKPLYSHNVYERRGEQQQQSQQGISQEKTSDIDDGAVENSDNDQEDVVRNNDSSQEENDGDSCVRRRDIHNDFEIVE